MDYLGLRYVLDPLLPDKLAFKRGNKKKGELEKLEEIASEKETTQFEKYRIINGRILNLQEQFAGKEPIFITSCVNKRCDFMQDFFSSENTLSTKLLEAFNNVKNDYVEQYGKFPENIKDYLLIPVAPVILPTKIVADENEELYFSAININLEKHEDKKAKGDLFKLPISLYTNNEHHYYNKQITSFAINNILSRFNTNLMRIYAMRTDYVFDIAKFIDAELRDFGGVMRNTDHSRQGVADKSAIKLFGGKLWYDLITKDNRN